MITRLGWLACALVVGCSSFGSAGDAGDAAGTDGGANGLDPVTGQSGPTLRIGVNPTTATVTQGSTVDVTVSVLRSGGLAGPVAFR